MGAEYAKYPFEHHITWACTAKKYGTLPYRPGTDMIALLQQAKWRVRHSEAKLEGHTAATGEADKICSLGCANSIYRNICRKQQISKDSYSKMI